MLVFEEPLEFRSLKLCKLGHVVNIFFGQEHFFTLDFEH